MKYSDTILDTIQGYKKRQTLQVQLLKGLNL
jgi:hypothetical protein